MLETERFALNRIVSPALGIEDFYKLAESSGLRKVELRNDLPGRDVIDGLAPSQALKLADDLGLEVVTINAVQKFNVASLYPQVKGDLEKLLDLASSIKCKALVLCPNNDPADKRSPEIREAETTEALASFGPLFKSRGMEGYVEPLGFGISSLSSIKVTRKAIQAAGFPCFRILHDTFHFYLGPDAKTLADKTYDAGLVGFVHVSSVEDEKLPKEKYLDEHRGLPSPRDRMDSKGQMLSLLKLGYKGILSFEPFGSAVQKLPLENLKKALAESLAYLRA